MNKKLFVMMILTGMFLVFGMLSASGETYSGTCGGKTAWTLDTGTGVLNITGSGYLNDYYYGATAPWYDYRNDVKTVVIQNGITKIGDYNFYECTALTDITIPDSVANIDSYAFSGCSSLISIAIPDIVTSIENGTFSRCSSLTSISIPDSVTRIGYNAFSKCSKLTSISIPNSVTSIEDSTFYECSSLTSIPIPDNVTSIGNNVFYGCSGLTSLSIPAGITNITGQLLSGCSSLTELTIPFIGASKTASGADSLFGYIFGTSSYPGSSDARQYYSSYNYTNYCIPQTLKTVTVTKATQIPYGAFSGCAGIETIYLNECITNNIGARAFYDCTGLKTIILPDSIKDIGESAFKQCGSLTDITLPSLVTSIGNYAFTDCGKLERILLPNSVTTLGSGAFSFCGFTSVTLPRSITMLGNSVFYCCDSLTDITVDKSNQHFSSLNGVLFSKDMTTLIQCPAGKENSYIIPDSVTDIGNFAFAYCRKFSGIEIPASVTGIGDSAFFGCSNLTSIAIPDSVTGIGHSAFAYCSKLTGIAIPSSVTNIKNGIFYECSSLADIKIPNSVTSIGSSTFGNCSSLTGISIPESVTVIGSGAFDRCSSLADIKIPDSVTNIGEYAFSECVKLTNIKVPGHTVIEHGILEGCSSLQSITLPLRDYECFSYYFGGYDYLDNSEYVPQSLKSVVINSNTNIYSQAFYGCKNITSITIQGSVTRIGRDAFWGCTALTEITLPFIGTSKIADGTADGLFGYIFGTASYTGGSATVQYYSENSSVTYYIPGSLRVVRLTGASQIPYGAFSGCRKIEEIYINEGITRIPGQAFNNCEMLQKVALPGSVTVFGNYAFNLSPNVTIYGKAGSKAETYAAKNSIPFVSTAAPEGVTLTASAKVIDGKVIITAISNSQLYDKVVHVALYSSGKLIEFVRVQAAMDEKSITTEFTYDDSVDKAKVFIWDNASPLKCLTEAAEAVIG